MRVLYPIQLRGHLTDDWSEWFASLRMTRLADGTTLLLIPTESATLHGVLARIRDLSLIGLAAQSVGGGMVVEPPSVGFTAPTIHQ